MKIYITFGQAHAHSVNGKTLDKDCVAVINAEDESAGRKLAFEWFDGEFHNSYTDKTKPKDLMDFFPRGLIEVNPAP